MMPGRSEMGTLDQCMFYHYRSVDCEHKTVVLERPMDPCLLSEADVGVPVDVFCKI